MEKRFLTIKQLAEYLNLPEGKVRHMSADNLIPGKISYGHKTVRFDRQSVDGWLQEKISEGNK